jgi:hypothetical protein
MQTTTETKPAQKFEGLNRSRYSRAPLCSTCNAKRATHIVVLIGYPSAFCTVCNTPKNLEKGTYLA